MLELAPQEKHVCHTFADISSGLPAIEEENSTYPLSVYQKSAAGPSASHRSVSPRDSEQETPTGFASTMPSSSPFLHTLIGHAVLQGPEALQQALDLYPQLLQDLYLDATISSESISDVRDSLQAIVGTAVQQPLVCLKGSRPARKLTLSQC
jgi:hypothetical protein